MLPKKRAKPRSRMVVIGGSAGGEDALRLIVGELSSGFALPIAVVLHLHPRSNPAHITDGLARNCTLEVSEAIEGERAAAGHIYLAPANYHLLFEPAGHFALSIDEKVHFSRPSIDMLFCSAADAFGEGLIGVLLSGASNDGAQGLSRIRECGGYTVVQDPETALCPIMPLAAMQLGEIDRCEAPGAIGRWLRKVASACRA
jgi:two-component system chemotaxis response regulator CheB